MKKQDAIQQAYGKYWGKVKEFVDENGFCHERKNIDFDKIFSDLDVDLLGYEWRPKSLRGIENNNGWTKIEKEADVPTDENKSYILGKLYPNGKFHQWGNIYSPDNVKAMFNSDDCTHYKEYKKELPPIY